MWFIYSTTYMIGVHDMAKKEKVRKNKDVIKMTKNKRLDAHDRKIQEQDAQLKALQAEIDETKAKLEALKGTPQPLAKVE